RAFGTTQPQAPLRCPGGGTLLVSGGRPRTPCLPRCYLARPPARPSGAPAREAMKEEAMKEAERRMPEPVISVRGEASLEVEPEIAVVWVSVAARDANRHRAIELLAGRTGRASDTIKGFGEAIEKLESQPVVVQPVFKDGRAIQKVSGYYARAGF